MRTVLRASAGPLVAALLLHVPARAQMGTAGVSDFLCGVWKSRKGEMTYLMLHNPTGVTRDAVILYYREGEQYAGCDVLRLSPHDFEKPSLSLPPADTKSMGMVIQGQGVVEIRSAPLKPEDPNHPGGLTGYVQVVDGESIYEFKAASPPPDYNPRGLTLGLAPLFPVDPKLFTPVTADHRENSRLIRNCVCNKLEKLQSPLDLRNVFCQKIE